MPKLLKSAQLAPLLCPGMKVFVQGSSGEPTTLLEALIVAPDACVGIDFISCQIPGLNHTDFAGLHPDARFTGLFVTPEMTKSYHRGKIRFMPLTYSSMYHYLQSDSVDIALIQVTPTETKGVYSLGCSAHFVPAVLSRAKVVVAEINEDLPSIGRGVSIDEERLDYRLPTSHGLPVIDA